MSVIVTGIDMPKSCAECQDQRCKVSDEWDLFDWCDYKRVDGCPLKSIDGLIEEITQLPTQENAEGQDMFQAYDVLRTIREYCEVKE